MPSINYLRTVCSLGPERVRVFLNYRLKLISLGLPLDPAVAHHAMEGDGGEFQDWELLPNSETTLLNSLDNLSCFEEGIKPDSDGIKPDSDGIKPDSDGIIPDSDGIIRSDYFSIHNHNEGGFPNSTVASSTKDDPSDQGSVEFDNPSWIDPGSDTRYATNNPPESWPDSSSDRSDCRPFTDFDANNEFGFLEDVKIQLGSERAEQIHFGDVGNGSNSSIVSSESERGYEISAAVDAIANDEQVNSNAKSDAEQGENRAVIWWKVPFVVFKYYVVRISSPVWTFSVAAAVVGFVILGRKLYKMKRKSQSLQLKVTMDDNKVSQFMSRAARLNEAFSVVKRVPIVCPSLPAAGVTLWPVMSLR